MKTISAGPYLDDSVNQHFMSLKTYKLEKNDHNEGKKHSDQISQQTAAMFDLEFISELFCIY